MEKEITFSLNPLFDLSLSPSISITTAADQNLSRWSYVLAYRANLTSYDSVFSLNPTYLYKLQGYVMIQN